MYRIALIRSASSNVPKQSYNVQEIGLATELAKKGINVDVFLISDKNVTYSEKCGIEDRVTVYRLKGIKIPGQQGFYKELIPILEKNKYDLIQALDDSQITTVLISKYCKRKNIKFILWQGMYENYPALYKKIIQFFFDKTFLRILRKNTMFTISKTSSAQKYLVEKNFPKGKVIPVGLETSNLDNGIDIDYREKYNIDNNKKIVLYIGKVEERRKPIFCIDVFNSLKKKYQDCCLIYVGQGPMRDEVKEYVNTKNIKDVIFIDKIPQSELRNLYKQSSIFILPTKYEIFGMVLMEAMYFEVPVITYKAAGPLDVIKNDVDGIVMNNFDTNEWANKISSILLKNKEIEMGRKAAIKIKSEYLWPYVAEKYYDEYIRIINS